MLLKEISADPVKICCCLADPKTVEITGKNIIERTYGVKPERIKENFEIFDFELTEDEMKSIDELNGKRGRVQYNSFIMYFALWLLPAPKD